MNETKQGFQEPSEGKKETPNSEFRSNEITEKSLRGLELENQDANLNEAREPIQNKQEGMKREAQVEAELKAEPHDAIHKEVCLRNEKGEIVKDPQTGEARRVDFMVEKDNKIVRSIEVTSETSDKTAQMEKEARIRAAGGEWIKTEDGRMLQIPPDVKTEIIRKP